MLKRSAYLLLSVAFLAIGTSIAVWLANLYVESWPTLAGLTLCAWIVGGPALVFRHAGNDATTAWLAVVVAAPLVALWLV